MAQQMKHAKKKVRFKKGYGFRRFLIVWIILLLIIGAVALVTVNKMLKEMQANTVEGVIADTLSNMSDADINKYFEFNKDYDSGNSVENVRKFFSDGAYTVKQNRDTGIYNIYNGDRQVLGVEIETVRKVNKYLIFNYNILKVKNIIPSESRELYHCEISAGSEYQISVNGKQIQPVSKDSPEGFLDASDYVEIPSGDRYILDHMSAQPEITITKNGQKVDFKYAEEIRFDVEYQKFDTLEAAGCDFDAMEFAKTWSYFMSADLGTPNNGYGFWTLAPYFIKDSEQYNKAWQWATAVDITFTWPHTFKNPPFTDERLTNVIKYSDDAYSVDVHFVKHMVLNANGNNLDDTMDNTIYIVKYNNEWKVVNIGAASEK